MALHWEEARVIVTCGDMRELGEVPGDAIVLTLKPEEVDDPEAIEAVRNLVLDRTIERRRQVLSDVYELGLSMPEPVTDEVEASPTRPRSPSRGCSRTCGSARRTSTTTWATSTSGWDRGPPSPREACGSAPTPGGA